MPASQKPIDFLVLLKQWIIIAVGVSLASFLNSGIQFESATSLILAVLFISALNVFIKPALVFFGLPFIVMTLGIGLLLINALIFALAGSLVPGFHVFGFWAAFWGAVTVSLTTLFVNAFLARPKVSFTRVNPPHAAKAKGGTKEYKGKLDDVIDV
jgi:putative membrane protein